MHVKANQMPNANQMPDHQIPGLERTVLLMANQNWNKDFSVYLYVFFVYFTPTNQWLVKINHDIILPE